MVQVMQRHCVARPGQPQKAPFSAKKNGTVSPMLCLVRVLWAMWLVMVALVMPVVRAV